MNTYKLLKAKKTFRTLKSFQIDFILMKDGKGIIQFYSVFPNGGFSNQITHNHFSVSATSNVSPDGQFLANGSGNNIYVTKIKTGITKMVTKD